MNDIIHEITSPASHRAYTFLTVPIYTGFPCLANSTSIETTLLRIHLLNSPNLYRFPLPSEEFVFCNLLHPQNPQNRHHLTDDYVAGL